MAGSGVCGGNRSVFFTFKNRDAACAAMDFLRAAIPETMKKFLPTGRHEDCNVVHPGGTNNPAEHYYRRDKSFERLAGPDVGNRFNLMWGS